MNEKETRKQEPDNISKLKFWRLDKITAALKIQKNKWCKGYLDLRWASKQACKRTCHWQLFDHLWGCSEPEAPTEGEADTLLADPFSTGGGKPHLPSDSRGSKT
jgi:hypothetical protein